MSGSVRIDRDRPMEMRDGVVLRADVYRPSDRAKHPAIFIRTPYNKQLTTGTGDFLNIANAAFSGYAVVIQDVRGKFASGGEYNRHDRLTVDGADGYDSVEWIAGQPWCDGNVGMGGASYLASLQWIVAMENPPHLKAISPWLSAAWTVHDQTLMGGTGYLTLAVNVVQRSVQDMADRLEKEGQDVSKLRQMLVQFAANPEAVYNFLPLKDVPRTKFAGVREAWEVWQDNLLNCIPGPELAGKAHWSYHRITVPVYHMDGWYDHHTWATFQNFQGMRDEGASPQARQGQHLLIGPWVHSSQLGNTAGIVHFGAAASGTAGLVSERAIAFYNKYLRGMKVSLPVIRYFVMGKGVWREADTWPLPSTKWRRVFFHSQGRANTSAGDGMLSWDEPVSEPPDIFVYNPQFPVPTVGGRLSALVPGPLDQSRIERRPDILCYTTAELEDDIEVTGPIEVHLMTATSARDTDFTAKLIDVYPDGQALNVAEGIIRARYRKSIFQPELLEPGKVYEYTINLGHTSQLFRRGHRIRLDISSSNFPASDRNMNTGNAVGEDAEGIPARQTIYHQPGCQSYFDLPVIPPAK